MPRFLACHLLLALLGPACLAAGAPPEPLGSQVFARERMTTAPTATGQQATLTRRPTPTLALLTSSLLTLAPRQAAPEPQRQAEEKLIVVQQGRVEVQINGASEVCGPGSVVFLAWNDLHAVRAAGDAPATCWELTFTSARTHDPYALNRSPSLGSSVRHWERLAAKSSPASTRRDVLQGSSATLERLSLHATTVPAGRAAHGAHRHPDDEIVLVLEGTMETTFNGRTEQGGPGSLFLFTSGDLHGLRNAGESAATYFIIRLTTTATPPAAAPAKS